MVTIEIKSGQQILLKKVTFGDTKRHSKKNEKYCEHKLTISYLFSIHVHKHHTKLKYNCEKLNPNLHIVTFI